MAQGALIMPRWYRRALRPSVPWYTAEGKDIFCGSSLKKCWVCPISGISLSRHFTCAQTDISEPVSLDLVFVKGGVAIDGAAQLKYDADQDGWYMGERLDSPEAVRAALEQAGALGT